MHRVGGFFFARNHSPQKGAAMTWKFHVHATEQRRLFSRILQILESQMVSIRSFAGEANDAEVWDRRRRSLHLLRGIQIGSHS